MIKSKPRYVIGMDGGGTKTAAAIADMNGSVLAEHVAGASNFQIIGVDQAAERIIGLVSECCNSVQCAPTDILSMTIGLTGAGRPVDQERMKKGIFDLAASKGMELKKVEVESDARIALEGAFRGAPGIILIAGTGSIAFGKDAKGVVHRVGGWGRILGDEGSGFAIGRSGLTAVTHHLDGRAGKTLLTALISREHKLSDQADIIAAVYRNNFDVASVAPLVFRAAEKKDPAAAEIVRLASFQLAGHVTALAKKLSKASRTRVKQKYPIAFIGGLIANETILSRMLRKEIQTTISNVQIIPPMDRPVVGAVLMSLPKSNKKA